MRPLTRAAAARAERPLPPAESPGARQVAPLRPVPTTPLRVKSPPRDAAFVPKTLPKTFGPNESLGSAASARAGFSYDAAVAHLLAASPRLEPIIRAHPPWSVLCDNAASQEPSQPLPALHYQALVKTIIYQQLHGKAAATILARFTAHFCGDGARFPTPGQVLDTPTSTLRTLGLSGQKTSYIQHLSELFASPDFDTAGLKDLPLRDLYRLLCGVKGIGTWTVDIFAMFTLGHPNLVLVGDLGIKKGMARFFAGETPLSRPLLSQPHKDDVPAKGKRKRDKDSSPTPPPPAPAPADDKPGSQSPAGLKISTVSARIDSHVVAPATPSKKAAKKSMAHMTEARVLELAERWTPYRSLGMHFMWKLANTECWD